MGLTSRPARPVDASGLTLAPPETLLASRAADFLTAGPADVQSLISHICKLPGAPLAVAEHMASALFSGDRRFVREGDGRWGLAAGSPSLSADLQRPVEDALAALSYVVVDVETTGGRAWGGDRVTEVAVVLVRNGAARVLIDTLVNPERPIPRYVTAVTNISSEMVRDAPPFRDVCHQVVGAMEGHVFVAHNAGFDWRFLSMEIERVTGRGLEGRRLCTVRLARKLLPQLRRRSLDHVAAHYGVSIGARHRAGGDALATAHVLTRLLDDAQDRGCVTWDDLRRFTGGGANGRRRKQRRRSALPQPVDRDTTA